VRNKYPEWWLVFVDYIGFGVDSCDEELYREHLDIEHDLDRLILLSPLDKTRAFEVTKKIAKNQPLATPLPPADAAN
jgi:hypothetical protein